METAQAIGVIGGAIIIAGTIVGMAVRYLYRAFRFVEDRMATSEQMGLVIDRLDEINGRLGHGEDRLDESEAWEVRHDRAHARERDAG